MERLAAALLTHYETKLWRLSHQLKNSAGVMFAERKLAGKLLVEELIADLIENKCG